MTPYWNAFIESQDLIKKTTSIPESDDLSGVGADIYWLTEAQSKEEKEGFYPGIAVGKDGFIPVGGCETGSGDPYFICDRDGPNGPLYRIYHDAAGVDGYSREEAVALVLNDYRDIIKYTE